ncbi:glutathione S-transferase family protein [Pelagimonas varians]|uniref:Tetrachloro-P-hydroquinone reductive dehalogenase n=1 Tax=Pelagimonas varians TaxID=696760 RepID=A0A238JVD1_9RHOB|nr:glutathione S-transferase family protein [Pelagimonas varians]PYG34511.1 glutathione S-transferase [Pelagimonas varians]SMX33772.1 Tetrachloro-P-hydroquinone reductive dehalogenase [Pelagimonas varians]
MFTLYHHGSSVCAAKVRFAMAEKGLDWEGVYIDILKGEQFNPDYMKLNPKAVVPTLTHDDTVIVDSTVIVEYLDQIAPDTSVHPTDPAQRAQARYWTKAVDEDLHPACGAVTFVCSHRHTVLKNLGADGVKKFLEATPAMSVTSNWKDLKDGYTRYGFDAPGAAEKVKLYDSYLAKMEAALDGRPEGGLEGGNDRGNNWLVGNAFSIADIAMTPYVNRLAMMSMRGMWENGRLPNVEKWFARIEALPNFKTCLIDWVPEDLTNDLRDNGAQSWPDIAKILEIEI